jgi:hypothetical protein
VADCHEVNVRVIESGNDEPPAGIDDSRQRADPLSDRFVLADGYYSITLDRHSIRPPVFRDYGVYGCVDYDKIGGRRLLPPKREATGQGQSCREQ